MSPARDESDSEGRTVVSPEELDIEERENVVALDEGRFVIGAWGKPSVPENAAPVTTDDANSAVDPASPAQSSPERTSSQTQPATDSTSTQERPSERTPRDETPQIDSEDVREWLEDELGDVAARYGFHITAKSEDDMDHHRMFSDDVGTVFDNLLVWYAQQVETEMPVEDVLGILMMESNVRVRYSPRCFRGILEAHGLSPDDSIADLFRAVRDANGIVFPPDAE